jgi:hypothetical protein
MEFAKHGKKQDALNASLDSFKSDAEVILQTAKEVIKHSRQKACEKLDALVNTVGGCRNDIIANVKDLAADDIVGQQKLYLSIVVTGEKLIQLENLVNQITVADLRCSIDELKNHERKSTILANFFVSSFDGSIEKSSGLLENEEGRLQYTLDSTAMICNDSEIFRVICSIQDDIKRITKQVIISGKALSLKMEDPNLSGHLGSIINFFESKIAKLESLLLQDDRVFKSIDSIIGDSTSYI